MAKLKEIRVTGLRMFGDLRVVPVESSIPCMYQIDEIVTLAGEYITWNERFSTPERALFYIAELAKAKGDSINYDD